MIGDEFSLSMLGIKTESFGFGFVSACFGFRNELNSPNLRIFYEFYKEIYDKTNKINWFYKNFKKIVNFYFLALTSFFDAAMALSASPWEK